MSSDLNIVRYLRVPLGMLKGVAGLSRTANTKEKGIIGCNKISEETFCSLQVNFFRITSRTASGSL